MTVQARITKVCGAPTSIMAIGLVVKKQKRRLRISSLRMSPAQRGLSRAARYLTLVVGSAAAVFTWPKKAVRRQPGLRFLRFNLCLEVHARAPTVLSHSSAC